MAGAGSVGPISLSTRCVMRPRSSGGGAVHADGASHRSADPAHPGQAQPVEQLAHQRGIEIQAVLLRRPGLHYDRPRPIVSGQMMRYRSARACARSSKSRPVRASPCHDQRWRIAAAPFDIVQLASGAPRVVRCRQMLAGHGLFPGFAPAGRLKNPPDRGGVGLNPEAGIRCA